MSELKRINNSDFVQKVDENIGGGGNLTKKIMIAILIY